MVEVEKVQDRGFFPMEIECSLVSSLSSLSPSGISLCLPNRPSPRQTTGPSAGAARTAVEETEEDGRREEEKLRRWRTSIEEQQRELRGQLTRVPEEDPPLRRRCCCCDDDERRGSAAAGTAAGKSTARVAAISGGINEKQKSCVPWRGEFE